jgi:uncharacterized phiE125 gp8 family phage protein
MTLELISPPAEISEDLLQSVCDHLRRYADLAAMPEIAPPDLAYIRELTRAAICAIDGPKGWLGRCLVTQTWKIAADNFLPEMQLALPPVRSVESVRYIDEAGTWQTVAPEAYRLFGAGAWSSELAPAFGLSRPSTRSERGAVEITVISGYGDSVEDVPASLRHGIRLLVAHWYLERQPITFSTPHQIPIGLRDVFQPYRVYR